MTVRSDHLGPPGDQLVMLLAEPERRHRYIAIPILEELLEERSQGCPRARLDRLLPLRRQDLAEWAKGHRDVDPIRTQVIDDRPDGFGFGERYALVAEQDSPVTGAADLVDQIPPLRDGRDLAGHGSRHSQDGLDPGHPPMGQTGIVDTLGGDGLAVAVEGALQVRRPGLGWADVDEPGARGQEQVVRSVRSGSGGHRDRPTRRRVRRPAAVTIRRPTMPTMSRVETLARAIGSTDVRVT